MSAPTQKLEEQEWSREIRHVDHPAHRRIDGIVALFIAVGLATMQVEQGSIYSERVTFL